MTNKLVVIINSHEVPKIKKTLLYEMKFLVPNYSCLQNPWLGSYRPPDPRSLCPLSSTEFVEPPSPEQNSWVRHWFPPWGRFSFQQKWVPGVSPGGFRRPALTADKLTTFMSWLSIKSDSFNPIQACNGIPLPLLVLIVNLFAFFLVFQFLPSFVVFFLPFYFSFPCVLLFSFLLSCFQT